MKLEEWFTADTLKIARFMAQLFPNPKVSEECLISYYAVTVRHFTTKERARLLDIIECEEQE